MTSSPLEGRVGAIALGDAVLLLVVAQPQAFEGLYIVDLVEGAAEGVHHVDAQRLDVLELEELEQLQHGRVEQVVAAVVAQKGVHHRRQQVALDDVPVVELVCKRKRPESSHHPTTHPRCRNRLLRNASLPARPASKLGKSSEQTMTSPFYRFLIVAGQALRPHPKKKLRTTPIKVGKNPNRIQKRGVRALEMLGENVFLSIKKKGFIIR